MKGCIHLIIADGAQKNKTITQKDNENVIGNIRCFYPVVLVFKYGLHVCIHQYMQSEARAGRLALFASL